MPQGFLSLHLDSGLALCAYTRAHTHTVPSMENFTALVLVCRFLCFRCFLSVTSAFLPFRNSSESLAASWLVWSLSRHRYTMSLSWSFSHHPHPGSGQAQVRHPQHTDATGFAQGLTARKWYPSASWVCALSLTSLHALRGGWLFPS